MLLPRPPLAPMTALFNAALSDALLGSELQLPAASAGPVNKPRMAPKQPETTYFPVSIGVLHRRRGVTHVARSNSLLRAYRRSRSRPRHSNRDFAMRKPSPQ